MKSIVTYREADGTIINFEAHSSLKSPIDLARYYAKEKNYPDRYVVFTDRLVKSKTVNTKDIESEAEYGIFMSCILRPSIFPSQAALLSALSTAAMVSALEEHTDREMGIGWVSDVYCDGMKIGSVSLEGKLDNFTTYEYIIISFNAKLSKDNFPPTLADMIKKVFESENTSVNMIIARSILTRFFKFYQNLKTPQKFMSEYTQRFALRGKKVKYFCDEKWKSHKVLGVDSRTGELIIDNGRDPDIRVSSPALIQNPKKIK
ncbi:MAG: hypothetical protein IKC61_01550 [Clostridia bacterium]|nr:hypothetical protein [Clostridia bacterium]